MNMICLVRNQIRDGSWKRRMRTIYAPVVVGTAVFFMALSSPCRAGDLASWYGEQHRGLLMANGQRFDPDRLTAASWFFELGTKVVVTHDDRSVIVEITDRGPAKRLIQDGRKIDLSRAAFAKLADPDIGLIEVTVRKY
jgi:rare lipoprotein A (peptidoglycan hydrolase)